MAWTVVLSICAPPVGQEMRQVGADHDQRFGAAPQAFQHLGHLCGVTSPTASGTSLKSSSTSAGKGAALPASAPGWAASLHHLRQTGDPPWRRGRAARCRAVWRSLPPPGKASPRTGTRCTGPSSTTRRKCFRARPAGHRRWRRWARNKCSRHAVQSAPWAGATAPAWRSPAASVTVCKLGRVIRVEHPGHAAGRMVGISSFPP